MPLNRSQGNFGFSRKLPGREINDSLYQEAGDPLLQPLMRALGSYSSSVQSS